MDTKAQAHPTTHSPSHAGYWCRCRRCSQSCGSSHGKARSSKASSHRASRSHCSSKTRRGRRTMHARCCSGRHTSSCPRNKRHERKTKRWRRKASKRSRCVHKMRRTSKGRK